MSAVAKGLAIGSATSTESIFILYGMNLYFPPGSAESLVIVANLRGGKGHCSGHYIRTIFAHGYLRWDILVS
jgi:hypothetical protein